MVSSGTSSQPLAVPVFVKGTHYQSGQEPEHKLLDGDAEHEHSAQRLELIGVINPIGSQPYYRKVKKEGDCCHQNAAQYTNQKKVWAEVEKHAGPNQQRNRARPERSETHAPKQPRSNERELNKDRVPVWAVKAFGANMIEVPAE